MNDIYRLMFPAPELEAEPCPCCGSNAVVWEYIATPESKVMRVVMCNHSDGIGPRDSELRNGCLLHMPPDDFYRDTGREAVKYWNSYSKALNAFRRKENWKRAEVLRKIP